MLKMAERLESKCRILCSLVFFWACLHVKGSSLNGASGTSPELNCLPCLAGYGVVAPCTSVTDTICSPCAPGYYNSVESAAAVCSPCISCDDGFFAMTPCSPVQNTQCRSCLASTDELTANVDYVFKCLNIIDDSTVAYSGDSINSMNKQVSDSIKTSFHMPLWDFTSDEGSGDTQDRLNFNIFSLTPVAKTDDDENDEGSGELSTEYGYIFESTKSSQLTTTFSTDTTEDYDEILEFLPVKKEDEIVEAHPPEPDGTSSPTATQKYKEEELSTETVSEVHVLETSEKNVENGSFRWPILLGIVGAGVLIYTILLAVLYSHRKRRRRKLELQKEMQLDYEEPNVRTTMIDKADEPLKNGIDKEEKTPIYNGGRSTPETTKYQPLRIEPHEPPSPGTVTPSKKRRPFGGSREFEFADEHSDDDNVSPGRPPSIYNEGFKPANQQNLLNLYNRFRQAKAESFEFLSNGRSPFEHSHVKMV